MRCAWHIPQRRDISVIELAPNLQSFARRIGGTAIGLGYNLPLCQLSILSPRSEMVGVFVLEVMLLFDDSEGRVERRRRRDVLDGVARPEDFDRVDGF